MGEMVIPQSASDRLIKYHERFLGFCLERLG